MRKQCPRHIEPIAKSGDTALASAEVKLDDCREATVSIKQERHESFMAFNCRLAI